MANQTFVSETYTMYYQGKPMEKKSSRQVLQQTNDLPRPQVQRRPSVYNQRAKEGFKFWLESDPMVKRISCKNTVFERQFLWSTFSPRFLKWLHVVLWNCCAQTLIFWQINTKYCFLKKLFSRNTHVLNQIFLFIYLFNLLYSRLP